jgi:hypothetical protein
MCISDRRQDVLDYYSKIMQFRGIQNPPGRFQDGILKILWFLCDLCGYGVDMVWIWCGYGVDMVYTLPLIATSWWPIFSMIFFQRASSNVAGRGSWEHGHEGQVLSHPGSSVLRFYCDIRLLGQGPQAIILRFADCCCHAFLMLRPVDTFGKYHAE